MIVVNSGPDPRFNPTPGEQHAEPTDEHGKKTSQIDIIRMDWTVHLMFIAMVLICADVAADISTVGLWAWLTTGCTRRMLELWQSSPLQRIYLPVLLALLVLSTVVEVCFGRSMVIRIDFALGTGGLLFKVAFSAARRQTHPPIATPQDPSGGTPPADVPEPPHGKDLLQFD